MFTSRPFRSAALALLAVCASTASASAGTVELSVAYDGNADVLQGIGSAGADAVTLSGTGVIDRVVITPGEATTITLAAGDSAVASRCTISPSGAATCDLAGLGDASGGTIYSDQVDLFLGAGDDTATADETLTTLAVLGLGLIGEGGNDDLHGGPGPDYLAGDDPSQSTTVAGHDRLTGGDGSDFFDGGPGNDMVFAGTGPDGAAPELDGPSDDGVDACGAGTDFLLVDGADAERLQNAASCELRVPTTVPGRRNVTMVTFSPNNGRTMHEVGQVLSAAATSTDPVNAPNDLEAQWLRCGSALESSCTTIASTPTFTIGRSMIGLWVGAAITYGWRIPENPWGYWRGGVESRISMRVGTESGPLDNPTLSTREGTRDALVSMLLPRTPYRLRTVARLPMVGGANGFTVRASAKLTVPAKALGRRGAGRVVIAAGTTTTTETVQLTLTLNAAGRKLVKRLRTGSKVQTRYAVRIDVGTPALTATRTVPITFKR